jgi:cytochrome c-type biogenesis protein
MPRLEGLHQRGRELGIEVVGVTTFYGHDSSPEGRRRELQEIADFLEANGITYPVVVADTMSNHDVFHVSSLPTSVLVSRDGEVIDYGVGLEGAEKVTEHALAAAE